MHQHSQHLNVWIRSISKTDLFIHILAVLTNTLFFSAYQCGMIVFCFAFIAGSFFSFLGKQQLQQQNLKRIIAFIAGCMVRTLYSYLCSSNIEYCVPLLVFFIVIITFVIWYESVREYVVCDCWLLRSLHTVNVDANGVAGMRTNVVKWITWFWL